MALRLQEAGVSEELIAECLQIERAAVRPLLAVAEAKVEAILARAVVE